VNEGTKKIIHEYLEKKDFAMLEKLLGKRLEFGTAGLRAAMGPGYNAMNDLVVIQTTQVSLFFF
jgi:phosphomannomutase